MASASQTPLRPQSPTTITVGGDTNKKRVLEGSISPPPSTDTQMDDAAANGHQPVPEPAAHPPPTPAPAYNPDNAVSDLSIFVSDLLGRDAGSMVASIDPSSRADLLIQLAITK